MAPSVLFIMKEKIIYRKLNWNYLYCIVSEILTNLQLQINQEQWSLVVKRNQKEI